MGREPSPEPAGTDDPRGRSGGNGAANERFDATSTSLIRGAAVRDERAWHRLVDAYGLMVYRWCRRSGLSPEDAHDVSQEVFAAVARAIDRFHRDQPEDSFRKWIRAITTNKIRDYWRSRRAAMLAVGGSTWLVRVGEVAPQGDLSSPTTLIGVRLNDGQPDEAVLRVRDLVSPRDWAIFERVVFDDQCPASVAEEFGVSPNVVYLVKSRILRALRTQIESHASMRETR